MQNSSVPSSSSSVIYNIYLFLVSAAPSDNNVPNPPPVIDQGKNTDPKTPAAPANSNPTDSKPLAVPTDPKAPAVPANTSSPGIPVDSKPPAVNCTDPAWLAFDMKFYGERMDSECKYPVDNHRVVHTEEECRRICWTCKRNGAGNVMGYEYTDYGIPTMKMCTCHKATPDKMQVLEGKKEAGSEVCQKVCFWDYEM